MLGDVSSAEKVYIACGYTDMQKSIDGLAAYVQKNMQMSPIQQLSFFADGVTG